METRTVVGCLILLALLAALLFFRRPGQATPRSGANLSASPAPAESTAAISVPPADRPVGALLLEGYADPAGSVSQDLQMIQRLLMSVRTLVKTQDPGRMAVNEDVVDVLLGKNNYQTRFLPPDHPAINGTGQLIDRWDSPLFFHRVSADRLDVRSAGPDRRLFTSDDCHLHADGAFLETEKLSGPPPF